MEILHHYLAIVLREGKLPCGGGKEVKLSLHIQNLKGLQNYENKQKIETNGRQWVQHAQIHTCISVLTDGILDKSSLSLPVWSNACRCYYSIGL